MPVSSPGSSNLPTTHGPSITSAFEQVVATAPNSVALRTQHGEITYREVDDSAAVVAGAILDEIGPAGEPIALALQDRGSAVTAMIAALKSGNIALPLTLDEPPSRVAEVIRRSGARLAIADGGAAAELADMVSDMPIIRVDRIERSRDPDHAAVTVGPESPALLLFTSGSTGRPKGVIRLHHQISTNALAKDIVPGDRLSQIYPPPFSAAIAAIFGALLNGATLCDFDVMAGGTHRLSEWVADEAISILGINPALFRRMLEGLQAGDRFSAVRRIEMGGEPLLRSDVDLFRAHFPSETTLSNLLASTEAEIVSRLDIGKDTVIDDEFVVSVGWPAPHADVHILDDGGGEVGPDEEGVLHVGGPLVTPGFWRDAELTEASFVAHPDGASGPLYRTGDLAMWRGDGSIQFIGRADHRVKVHGAGIDLLEVEHALVDLDPVHEAVVVVDGAGDAARLIAYVVLHDPAAPVGAGILRSMLADRLPRSAIPGIITPIESIPLTPRGKIDRRALPRPGAETEPRDIEIAHPADDVERALVDIWEEVLSMGPIGVHDHFFDDLGGSSMQGLRMFAAISRHLHLDLAPTTLLTAPTVASLAEVIRRGGGAARQTSLVPIRKSGSLVPFFCVHGGEGGVFFVRDIAAYLDPARPVYGLQAPGFEGVPSPYRPVEELATRYVAEVQGARPHGPYLLGGLSFGGLVALEMGRQLREQGEEVSLVVLLDTKLPTDQEIWEEAKDPGRHWKRMRANGLRGLVYPVVGVARRLRNSWRASVIRLSMRLGRRLSPTLRHHHYWTLYSRATREYTPGPYDGRTLVIAERGASEYHRQRWEPVVGRRLRVREAAVGHHDLATHPFVETLGEILEEAFSDLEGQRLHDPVAGGR
jgi:acyl-coenzyme A synthetase/AMP-(fatty) acid ligase/thioesterase domain-containing protein